MSAFMVEDKTINDVANWLLNERGIDSPEEIKNDLSDLGYDVNTVTGTDKLAQAMFKLNEEAIGARYGEGEAAKFRPLDFKFKLESVETHQVLKSLECWLYQCTEGNIPSESKLYKIMQELANKIAKLIAHQSKYYEMATWG